mgnify:CR=1 FL=1
MSVLQGRILKNLLISNSIGAPTILMKKSVFEEIGGFDESMRCLEDWEFAIRLSEKYEVDFILEPLLLVSVEGERASTNLSEYFNGRCYILNKHADKYKENGLYDQVKADLISQAESVGIRQQVEKILEKG